jgi:addiction module RelE/StbE family toxin
MLKLQWTTPARRDLMRLYDFLKDVSPGAAKRILNQLAAAAEELPMFPHIAPRLEDFHLREVRSLPVGDYIMRYEVLHDQIRILRIWHMREDR